MADKKTAAKKAPADKKTSAKKAASIPPAARKAAAKKVADAKKAELAKKGSTTPGPVKGESDMKAKFREALEKKNSSQHASAEGAEHDGSEKSHGATGPTMAPEFRRKSV